MLLNWSSYKFNSVSVNVSAPVSTKGVLHLPAHGKKDIKVKEGNEIAYNTKEGQMNQCCVFTVNRSKLFSKLTSKTQRVVRSIWRVKM